MAKTIIRHAGPGDAVVTQSRLGGLRIRNVALFRWWHGTLAITAEVKGVKVNRAAMNSWDKRKLSPGDMVILPWGGKIIITEEIIQNPEKMSVEE